MCLWQLGHSARFKCTALGNGNLTGLQSLILVAIGSWLILWLGEGAGLFTELRWAQGWHVPPI